MAVTAAGCGRSTHVGAAGPRVVLQVEVRPTAGGPPQTAGLTCDGADRGTGFLAAAGAAMAACASVDDHGGAALLRDPHPVGQVCSMIYGGPETAVVTGTIDGQTIAAHLNRADGCGTAAWATLRPLLQP